jgi:hypothetical protein
MHGVGAKRWISALSSLVSKTWMKVIKNLKVQCWNTHSVNSVYSVVKKLFNQ